MTVIIIIVLFILFCGVASIAVELRGGWPDTQNPALLPEEEKKRLFEERKAKKLEEEAKWDSWGVMKAMRMGKW
jgi:uncharacterized membrane protein